MRLSLSVVRIQIRYAFKIGYDIKVQAITPQELLFCETCDCVFCSTCTAGSHIITPSTGNQGNQGAQGGADRNSSNSDHTVIPFSIAIKRMSEILLYKANECTSKVKLSSPISNVNKDLPFQLDTANETVTKEMHKLDHRGDAAYEEVRLLFEEVVKAVEKRRDEVLLDVKRKKDEKGGERIFIKCIFV